jgi:dolichol-phosphate mannosyltransferase
MLITVIIPCYNEENTLEKIVNKILDQKDFKIKIIIVDDNSKDLSTEIIKNNLMNNKVDKVIFHKKNLGKGACIKSAQPFVEGEYVIIQDADLEYNPENYKFLLNKMIKDQAKVVYGSRVLKEENNKRIQNFSHKLRIYGNYILTKISNFFNNQNLTDAHTCYKMFEAKLFKKIKLHENDFAFCPEITTKISLLNINIKEVPIDYNGRTYDQGKKIQAIDALKAIWTIIKYRYFK